jgi:hypothetical protein
VGTEDGRGGWRVTWTEYCDRPTGGIHAEGVLFFWGDQPQGEGPPLLPTSLWAVVAEGTSKGINTQ